MIKLIKLSLLLAVVACLTNAAQAQISYTGGTYAQDFDVMGTTGTTTPPGWFAGTGGDSSAAVITTAVVPGTGSGSVGNNYNFGVSGVNSVDDRALGSLASAGTQRDTEIHITNSTGGDIPQFSISYDGEQWRSGGASQVPNTLTLQISLTGLGNSWVSLGSNFNFTTPVNGATAGPLDGNAAANRVAGIGGTFNPSTPIVNGSTFFLRFADPDDGGTDAGIAIDSFTFIAVPEPSVYMLLGVGILLCGQRFRRRKSS